MEFGPKGEDYHTGLPESRQFFVCSRAGTSEESWPMVAFLFEDRQLADRLSGPKVKPGPNGSVAAQRIRQWPHSGGIYHAIQTAESLSGRLPLRQTAKRGSGLSGL
jgi:hypothetical protein